MRRLGQLAIFLLLLVGVSFAGDIAYLRNGFTIRCENKETLGDKTRLYTSSGFVDVATAEIEQIVHDDTPAPRPAASTPATDSSKTIDQHLSEASRTSGIDRDFLESVIHHESGFNPKAVSPKGARGLMQLMPDTANQLGVKDSFDPGQNIQGGTAYLKQLLEMYHGDAQKALAAYNAGPHRVEQYKGVPPYRETRAYVTRIIREYNRKKLAEQAAARMAKAKSKSSGPHSATKSRIVTTQASSKSPRPTQPGS
jgi:soluble lytic murein transglycosylase-like protein